MKNHSCILIDLYRLVICLIKFPKLPLWLCHIHSFIWLSKRCLDVPVRDVLPTMYFNALCAHLCLDLWSLGSWLWVDLCAVISFTHALIPHILGGMWACLKLCQCWLWGKKKNSYTLTFVLFSDPCFCVFTTSFPFWESWKLTFSKRNSFMMQGSLSSLKERCPHKKMQRLPWERQSPRMFYCPFLS